MITITIARQCPLKFSRPGDTKQENTGRRASKKEKKISKDTKVSRAKILSKRVGKYDLINGFAQANAGMNIG